jgi:hypothetical protein
MESSFENKYRINHLDSFERREKESRNLIEKKTHISSSK